MINDGIDYVMFVFFFKQKTAYEMRISDWSSDVCSSDLVATGRRAQAACDELIAAYRYLRRVEHRLQMIDDEQTHTLPEDPDRLAHLACFLGAADTAAFAAELLAVLQRVKAQYDDLFSEAPALSSDAGSLVFTGKEDDPATLRTLSDLEIGRAHV